MKTQKRLIIITLGLTVLVSSAAFGIKTIANSQNSTVAALVSDTNANKNFSDIVMSPGGTPSEMNFNWYSNNSSAVPTVQIALKSDVSGSDFPADKCATFTGATSSGNSNFTANKVSVNGLKQSTQYVYRLGDGTNWSPIYSFTTHETNQYNFLFAGDPQIGASGDIAGDTKTWKDSLDKITSNFADTSFMISVGDQVNNGKELNGQSNEVEYSGYFAPSQFQSLPVAAIAGNHETYGVGHNTHFNVPNSSDKYGACADYLSTGTDYYFTYGNTLYLMLNSNDMNEADHEAFMKDAISKNPNALWKIAVLHHSVYSSANHETDTDIIQRRNDLTPIFDKVGIDVVLDGHDHCYTRSYQMKGGQAIKDQTVDKDGRIIDPKGVVYITANSASGSKYYEIKYPGENSYFEAKKEQDHAPTFSRVSISSNSLKIDTYRTDNMSQIDTYTLVKSSAPEYNTQSVIDKINNLPDPTSITLNDENNVQDALNAYNTLTPDQKKLVSNADKLTQTENKITALKQQEDNQSAANDVIKKIDAIPDKLTINDEKTVKDARTAYDALTDLQKPMVSNYSKLTNAEETLPRLNSGAQNSLGSSNNTAPLDVLPKTGEFMDSTVLLVFGLISLVIGTVIVVIDKRKSRLN